MSKFKVGDRARSSDGLYLGTVTHFCDEGLPVMDTDGIQDSGWPEGDLELVARPQEDTTTLTRRDQFAMAALTGMCAHPDCEGSYRDIAEQVYRLADAMEAARNKEGGE